MLGVLGLHGQAVELLVEGQPKFAAEKLQLINQMGAILVLVIQLMQKPAARHHVYVSSDKRS